MGDKGADKRRYKRLTRDIPALCSLYCFGAPTAEHDVTVKNVSAGGVLFESKVAYEKGQSVKLKIIVRGVKEYHYNIPNELIYASAKVVRVIEKPQGIHDIAVEFLSIKEADKKALNEYIKTHNW